MNLTTNFLLKKPDGTDPVKLQDFNDNADTLDVELALQRTAIDAADTHSNSAHVTGIKGSSETAYRTGQVNITKENIGLGNVPNVATNDQTPTYTEATVLSELTSGEKLSVALGKIKLAVKNLKTLLQLLGNTDISGVGNGTVTGALTAINSNLNNLGSYSQLVRAHVKDATQYNFSTSGYRYVVISISNAQGYGSHEFMPSEMLYNGMALELYNVSEGWNLVKLTQLSSGTWSIGMAAVTSYIATYGFDIRVCGIK